MEDPTTQPQPDDLDALLPILADAERRRILTHIQDTPAHPVTLEELTTHLTTDIGHDPERIRIRLHHVHLPKLAATGIIDYDPRTNTVRYDGHAGLETLLNSLETSNFTATETNRDD